jgi:hypothetical protein
MTNAHTISFYRYVCGNNTSECDSRDEKSPPPVWLEPLSCFAQLALALLVVALLWVVISLLACVVVDILFAPLRWAAGLR